nr:MAG TPA: Protein of unknown function (DUF3116) [Bacteriophage sp.]
MARRPGGILASLTVGELAFLRVVGWRHKQGEPFCSTEVTRRGGDENVKLFRGMGRDGIAEICGGLVSKGLLRRERGTHRYSLTERGAGGYSELRDTFPKPLRDSKGMYVSASGAATEDDT